MSSCCHENDLDIRRHHFPPPRFSVSSDPANGQTGVSPDIKSIKLILDGAFPFFKHRDGCSTEIDMWQGMNRIPIRIKRSYTEPNIIYVIPVNRLRGGVTYKVRIKSYFIDEDGNKDKRIAMIVFSTRCRS